LVAVWIEFPSLPGAAVASLNDPEAVGFLRAR